MNDIRKLQEGLNRFLNESAYVGEDIIDDVFDIASVVVYDFSWSDSGPISKKSIGTAARAGDKESLKETIDMLVEWTNDLEKDVQEARKNITLLKSKVEKLKPNKP